LVVIVGTTKVLYGIVIDKGIEYSIGIIVLVLMDNIDHINF